MSDPHSPAGAVAAVDDEPKTPMWLPVLGAVLFLGVAAAWAVSSFSHAHPADAASAATVASTAATAAAPRPSPSPPPAQAAQALPRPQPPQPIARPAAPSATGAVPPRARPQEGLVPANRPPR